MKREATLYAREGGPVCWEATVFPAPDQPGDALVRLLRESGLGWWWESVRSHADQESSDPSLPEARPWTRLHPGSEGDLLRDLAETDEDDYRRFLTLVATDADAPGPGPDGLQDALAAFCRREDGPVRAVVVQVGDSPAEHVYVPHHPVPGVRALLAHWGLDAATTRTVPYRRLHMAALESLYGIAP